MTKYKPKTDWICRLSALIANMEHGGLIEAQATKHPETCHWKAPETCKQCKQDYPGIKCEDAENRKHNRMQDNAPQMYAALKEAYCFCDDRVRFKIKEVLAAIDGEE